MAMENVRVRELPRGGSGATEAEAAATGMEPLSVLGWDRSAFVRDEHDLETASGPGVSTRPRPRTMGAPGTWFSGSRRRPPGPSPIAARGRWPSPPSIWKSVRRCAGRDT